MAAGWHRGAPVGSPGCGGGAPSNGRENRVAFDEIVQTVRRRWKPVLILAVLIMAAAAITTPKETARVVRYRASATVAIFPTAQPVGLPLEPVSPDIAAAIAAIGEVPQRAATQLGFSGDPARLAQQVTMRPNKETATVELSVTSSDGKRAADIANAFAGQLVKVLEERRIKAVEGAIEVAKRQSVDLQTQLNILDRELPSASGTDFEVKQAQRSTVSRQLSVESSRIQQLQSVLNPAGARISVVREAVPSQAASAGVRPPAQLATRLAVSGILGLALGVGLVVVMERSNPRLRSRRLAEEAFGLPVVAEIPESGRATRNEILIVTRPQSNYAEAYRNLRSAATLMPVLGHPNGVAHEEPDLGEKPKVIRPGVILVTSPGPGEGKTTTVANLAASFAELGMSVLVVDGDLRRPRVAALLGVPDGPGLTDVDLDRPGESLKELTQKTTVPGVWLLRSGSQVDNPAAAITRRRSILDGCRRAVQVVIIDTPPLLVANDARELFPVADAVILVGRTNLTSAQAANDAADLLRRLKVPLVGVAMVGESGSPRGYGRYYYGYQRANDAAGRQSVNGKGSSTNGSGNGQDADAGKGKGGNAGKASVSARKTSSGSKRRR